MALGSDTGARRPGAGAAARGLLKACHPGPCVTVTGLAVAIGWASGSPPDASRCSRPPSSPASSRSAGSTTWSTGRRTSRPIGRTSRSAMGSVAVATVRTGFVVAAVASVPLSFALGWAAGRRPPGHRRVGWAYDLRLKRTVWSWLPYVVAFGGCPPSSCWRCRTGRRRPGGAAWPAPCSGSAPTRRTRCRTSRTTVGWASVGLPPGSGRWGAASWRPPRSGSRRSCSPSLRQARQGPGAWVALAAAVVLLAVGLGRRWPAGVTAAVRARGAGRRARRRAARGARRRVGDHRLKCAPGRRYAAVREPLLARLLALPVALALAATLSGCGAGFHAGTNRPYVPSNGTSLTVGTMDARNLLLVEDAARPGTFHLIGALVNNGADPEVLTAVAVEGAGASR